MSSVGNRTDTWKSGSYSPRHADQKQELVGLAISGSNAMAQFYFRIRDGRFGGPAHHAIVLADRDAAWNELALVSKDLVGSIAREIKQNAEWQIELLDESERPVFRIRLIAETFDEMH
jgi:hypothetical protein